MVDTNKCNKLFPFRPSWWLSMAIKIQQRQDRQTRSLIERSSLFEFISNPVENHRCLRIPINESSRFPTDKKHKESRRPVNFEGFSLAATISSMSSDHQHANYNQQCFQVLILFYSLLNEFPVFDLIHSICSNVFTYCFLFLFSLSCCWKRDRDIHCFHRRNHLHLS